MINHVINIKKILLFVYLLYLLYEYLIIALERILALIY